MALLKHIFQVEVVGEHASSWTLGDMNKDLSIQLFCSLLLKRIIALLSLARYVPTYEHCECQEVLIGVWVLTIID